MLSTTDIRQKAIALIGQLPQDTLMAVVQLLELLAEPSKSGAFDGKEAQLLAIVQQDLPKDEQIRLHELRDRCEWGELSQSEHQELIGYEDRLEQQRIERLEALMALAKVKNIDLMNLNQQIQSDTQPSNVA
jgi:hypothetical protein